MHVLRLELRDYFAGQALSGAMSLLLTSATSFPDAKETVASWAYEVADAMLKAKAGALDSEASRHD